jgi:hypothetical protein
LSGYIDAGHSNSEQKRRRKSWTLENIRKLMMLYKIYDSKWSKIAAEFSGMTENDIKNKFYSTLKSIASKVQPHPTLLLKRKKDLIQYVDVAMIHEELLPCKHDRIRKKTIGGKRKREVNVVSEDSAKKDSGAEPNDSSVLIWPGSHILETKIFSKALSRMIWGETNITQIITGICKINECLPGDEIKSNP